MMKENKALVIANFLKSSPRLGRLEVQVVNQEERSKAASAASTSFQLENKALVIANFFKHKV
jgi:hypothetical protein